MNGALVKYERVEWVDGFLRVGTIDTMTGQRHYFSFDALTFEQMALKEREKNSNATV